MAPQHDYVIANGSGSAVRGDLNTALTAIASLNSGTGDPAAIYTVAYMLWADTSNGLLKMRNGADDGWITLRELDGTLIIEGGSASTPGLYFTGDANTGIYSPGADQFAIATNGVERVEWGTSEVVFNDGGENYDFRVEGDTNANLLFVDASTDRVGFGVSNPATRLDVDGDITIRSQGDLRFGDSDNSNWVALQAPATVSSNFTWTLPAADGTADQSIVTDGSGALSFASRSRLVAGTSVASTSGTSIDFTSIPSWVKRITVMLDGVSTNGTSSVRFQIGPVAGVETSGYVGVSTGFAVSSLATNVFTAGADLADGQLATTTRSGQIVFSLLDAASNIWAFSGNFGQGDTSRAMVIAGSKSLAGSLSIVRITTVGGTDTFDAGTVNILYEG